MTLALTNKLVKALFSAECVPSCAALNKLEMVGSGIADSMWQITTSPL